MASLFLDSIEISALDIALATMEEKYGAEYSYTPDYSEYSCSCSGPQQSCVWH